MTKSTSPIDQRYDTLLERSHTKIILNLTVSARCCIDGSSIHQPIFYCSSQSPDTIAPIQSSTSLSQGLFGLPLFLCTFTCPSSINFSCLVSFYMSEITLCLLFDTVEKCSRCDSKCISYVLVCSVHDTKKIRSHLFSLSSAILASGSCIEYDLPSPQCCPS